MKLLTMAAVPRTTFT